MKKDDTLAWLSQAIADAMTASATFQTSGEMPAIDPDIVVDGLGTLRFPLKPAAVKGLKALGKIAPYGKGVRTLVNCAVRDTIELDPGLFRLGGPWRQAIDAVTRQVGRDLGLEDEQLEAHLYKLLLYEKGGRFLPHRDSEKLDGMVASLIVVLPNPFDGGELEVRHAGNTKLFNFSRVSGGGESRYAAFYADCEHEVKPVTFGVRLCLAYNLVLRRPRKSVAPSPIANPLVDAIQQWVTSKPAVPLVFALEHQYTPASLSQELLKGADRALAKLVLSAAACSGGVATFARIERHATYSAFEKDDDYGGRYRGRYDDGDDEDDEDYEGDGGSGGTEDIEIQELIEEEFSATEWTSPDGKKQTWGELPLDTSAVVCREPVDQWTPAEEEYEGYTGNAGNTLDRWYHRTALIVWPRSAHYEILASAGLFTALPLFATMVKKLPKTPKDGQDVARNDCIHLAHGIISQWPVRWASHGAHDGAVHGACESFPEGLLALGECGLIQRFLAKVNLHDEMTAIDDLIISAVRHFGWDVFAKDLTAFFLPKENKHYAQRSALALRDASWLYALAAEASTDNVKTQRCGHLCQLAVEFFCKQGYADWWHRPGSGPTDHERIVPLLVKSALLAKQDVLVTRVLKRIREHAGSFGNKTCHVPALKELAPWSRKHLAKTPPVIADWLKRIRDELMAATAARPQPPGDWRRPSNMGCNCKFCGMVKAFLDDPCAQTYSLRAAEFTRSHVTDRIANCGLDLSSKLHKVGSPYTLILTKTAASHERAVKQYDIDVALLDALPVLA